MDVNTVAVVMAGGGALGILVWLLAKLGKALITIAEALAAAAVVFLALWLAIKAVVWAFRQTLTHWRTSLSVCWRCWHGGTGGGGHRWPSPGPGSRGCSPGGRLLELASFDAWAGRHLRAWWLRWTVYAPKLPDWLHACGLGITQDAAPVVLALTPLGHVLGRKRRPVPTQLPKVLGVCSGASWDEVRVGLILVRNRRISMKPPAHWLGSRGGAVPGPGTHPQRGLDRFSAPQPARRRSGLP